MAQQLDTTINNDGTVNAPVVVTPAPDVNAPAITPVVPAITPDKEVVSVIPDDDKIDIGDFDKVIGEGFKHPEKPVVPAKKDDDKKDDTKVVAIPADKKDDTKVAADKIAPQARDYTGVPEPIAAVLKNTSNEAFNTLKPLILEHIAQEAKVKALDAELVEIKKGRPPENYQEHPEGFILSPEFRDAAKQVQEASVVFNHWKQQLDAVENGALKYHSITRDAQGNLVLGQEQEAGADAKSKLLYNFNWAQQQLTGKQAKIETIQELHKTRYTEAKTWLDNAEKDWFKDIAGNDKHPLQPMIKSTMESFPPTFRANPMSRPLATALTLCVRFAEVIGELQKNGGKLPSKEDADKQKQEEAKKQAKEAGPTAVNATGATAPGKAKGEDVTMDDFEAVIQG